MGVTAQAINRDRAHPENGGNQRLSRSAMEGTNAQFLLYYVIKWIKRNLCLLLEWSRIVCVCVCFSRGR